MPRTSSASAWRCSSRSPTRCSTRSSNARLPGKASPMNLNVTLFAQAVTFFLFIIVSVKWVWPIVLRKIEERQKLIADGLAEAERGRSSLADAQKQTEELLRDARARAQEIVAAAEKSATLRIEESKSQAKTEGERLVLSAKAQIDQEGQSANQKLRGQVASPTVSAAEKVLPPKVDPKPHPAILNHLKAQLYPPPH